MAKYYLMLALSQIRAIVSLIKQRNAAKCHGRHLTKGRFMELLIMQFKIMRVIGTFAVVYQLMNL
jgi:hypothetical protein